MPHRAAAISDADAHILSAIRLLGGSTHRKATSVSAVAPIVAPQFPKTVIAAIGRDRVDLFIDRPKNPRLAKPPLRVLADPIKSGPIRASAAVPFLFGEWGRLIPRFYLADRIRCAIGPLFGIL